MGMIIRNYQAMATLNISYFTVPVALCMALGVRTYPIMSKPGQKLLDRNKPRDFVEVLKKANLDENVRGRLLRAEGCAANWFEALPVFAAAVTAGNSAGVSPLIMNCLSIGWLVSRLLYTYV